MLADLFAGLVQALQRGAGQFKLTTWLKGNRPTKFWPGLFKRYDVLSFDNPAITKAAGHLFQERIDSLLAIIGKRTQVFDIKSEFLVLCADPPFRFWLAAAFKLGDQLVPGFNQRAFLNVLACGHFFSARFGLADP